MHPDSSQAILMVDDDPSVTETSCRVLQLEGFTVYSALSPTGGLELASDKLPDAIELDLRMPILSGVRFLELLRERPALEHTPVAIVTGDYFGLHRHDVADRGARGVGAFQADLDGRSRHPRQRPDGRATLARPGSSGRPPQRLLEIHK